MTMKQKKRNTFLAICILAAAFLAGRTTASGVKQWKSTYAIVPQTDNWGLGFGKNGSQQQPSGNVTAQELQQYDAYYVGDAKEKVIYLTFGFEP